MGGLDKIALHSHRHYSDVIMSTMASQITSLAIVYTTVYSGADQRKHQSSASLAFVRGIHRWPVNSPHKGPVTRRMFPFDGVIMDKPIQTRWHPRYTFATEFDLQMTYLKSVWDRVDGRVTFACFNGSRCHWNYCILRWIIIWYIK